MQQKSSFLSPASDYQEDVASCREAAAVVISGDQRKASTVRESPVSVGDFAVIILVGGAAEHPASGPELQDLQQQEASHGGQALLQEKAVPQQEEQLVHPLAVHLLQLLPDAMQLQHQAVHLQRRGRRCFPPNCIKQGRMYSTTQRSFA